MKVQVLLSTMNQRDYSILDKMNVTSDAVVINQCDHIGKNIFVTASGRRITWIDSNDRGLSKSRNYALREADSEICIIADDDLEYVPNYENIVLNAFEQHPDTDIITFQVKGIERSYKKYYPKQRRFNRLTSMKISSVEIAFKLQSLRSNGIIFNELFGAGAQYCVGEENILIAECLKHGLIIDYVPQKIADLHLKSSSWFNGFNRGYFINRGAVFAAMYKLFSIPLIIQFAVRKRNLYSENMSLISAFLLMIEGRRIYLNSYK